MHQLLYEFLKANSTFFKIEMAFIYSILNDMCPSCRPPWISLIASQHAHNQSSSQYPLPSDQCSLPVHPQLISYILLSTLYLLLFYFIYLYILYI